MVAHIWLIVYRPLQRHPAQPPSLHLPSHATLSLAIRVIECYKELEIDPSLQDFRWVSSIWSQRHALAVMIADLQVHVEGIVVERAWTLLEEVFDAMAVRTADSRQGRIWRFIEKMMAKAREVRKKHLASIQAYGVVESEPKTISSLDVTSTTLGFGNGVADARTQMQPAQNHPRAGSMCSLDELAGPPVEQGFNDYPYQMMNEPQNHDCRWVAEWEAFVEEYHNAVRFPI